MKQKHIYIIGALALLILAVVCLYQSSEPETVRAGYAAAGVSDQWSALIAGQVNKKGIRLVVDGKQIDGESPLYMTENMQVMLPVSSLRDAFSCKAGVYDNKTIKIYRNDRAIEAESESGSVLVNSEAVALENPVSFSNSEFYISSDVIAQGLDYSISFDSEQGVLQCTDNRPDASKLPASYDPRSYGLSIAVMDQGKLGTCWAFASIGALEIGLLPEEHIRFSVDHMSLNNGYTWTQDTGGEYTMAMAYLLSWKGPVLEEDDPYGDGVTDTTLTAIKHVSEIQILQSKDQAAIKRAVYLYGSVQTSMYCEISSESDKSDYYNQAEHAYCYIGTEKINHDTLIVGWDDSYPAENFKTQPGGNGAYLCVNSWGEQFGDGGYFWVSYYDSNIGIYNVAYTDIDSPDNYDNIYQADICGWVGQLGYGSEEAYFSNFYTAKSRESLKAVGFYAVGADTDYEVYIVHNAQNSSDLSFQQKVASGSLANAGFYTIKLDSEAVLEAGEEYAVIVYVRTPGEERPVAVEYSSDDGAVIADLSDGKGYISMKGNSWQSAEQKYNCNICLKAYTDTIEQ